ncbi:MAG TPA: flagellar biosynthesis protein FlhF, partial [Chromatiales bacterium]|nr:flagellar biosynthesis protein FlhF [Chromatiales bacterium]
MKIKRFSGKDMREAMRRVRESFGPDAVILETDRVDGRLEITAAMDFDPAAYQQARMSQTAPAPAAQIDCTDEDFESSVVLTETPVAGTADTASAAELARMRDEVQTIRCLLEAQLSRL